MRHVHQLLEIMYEVQVLYPADPLEDSCDLEVKPSFQAPMEPLIG
jgi:hypothetical protein